MSYIYEEHRQYVFTDEGQRQFLSIRDHVAQLWETAGACTVGKAIAGQSGDSWQMLACVDRLVELGEARYLDTGASTQRQVLVPTRRG